MQDFGDSGAFPRRRGSGSWLTHTMVAVLAAGLAVAVVLGFFSPTSGGSMPGSGVLATSRGVWQLPQTATALTR